MRWTGQVGGRPCVVVLAGGDPAKAVAVHDRLGPGVDRHLVVDAPADAPDAADHLDLPDEAFLDQSRQVQQAWGVTTATGPTVAVVDRAVRVASVHAIDDVDEVAATVSDDLADLQDRHRDVPPPVLFVPAAISAGMADRVRRAWADADPRPTGVETTADGRRVEALDHLRKRRRDHVVEEPELLRALTRDVGRRVVPEVRKAFGFSTTAFEGFKVGAYDADDEGFFDAHRDNLSPATAHRRFALSLNLDDDYDGGELVFPEYADRPLRPAAREALVFSGSLLHAVRPVTRGRRLVLLSFLFDAGSRG
ncbi:2OG-Fe(II) oxygenase [Salsipaludibacter albus]|uniref:2OG-Fe(II) oxygenase n=1 Tax=Salsipaludibacter albus TaxID=2849650 RepID=UPI001EE413D5|nr:2OG-Fe(II) oxygenase [Salsipaludibacter albus]